MRALSSPYRHLHFRVEEVTSATVETIQAVRDSDNDDTATAAINNAATTSAATTAATTLDILKTGGSDEWIQLFWVARDYDCD